MVSRYRDLGHLALADQMAVTFEGRQSVRMVLLLLKNTSQPSEDVT